ncbi:MAG: ABC transporter ATP-binding protein [Deltaproteobacteria bacterium]|nr:ABC transporter ATP-binding protein [Deltaproteobacteria bacterium]
MLEVRGLAKRFVGPEGSVQAVADVSFRVPRGTLFTLLGPSGCGKTTTLRCVAGLERPEAGEIVLHGAAPSLLASVERRITVPANRRPIGMVFQSYAIWPHMTVFENVAYPLRIKRTPQAEMRRRVMEVLEVVGLASLRDRGATQLSGGQQQRVALARALVREPQLLLLDEPLSNLDAKLREQMRAELRALQRRLGITTLYVTHDQVEALAISDTIAVMDRGRILAQGTPREIYHRPGNEFVADFVGLMNVIEGRLDPERREGLRRVSTPLGPLYVPEGEGIEPGAAVKVLVRPENLHLTRGEPPEGPNVWKGEVVELSFLGEAQDCVVAVGPIRLRARIHPLQALRVGEAVHVRVAEEGCALVRKTEG